ncbi:MAG: hypothetical protein OEU26_11890 [Candidatus Tectomicrobia bacterium]|nr:hypothetical protein [Candidatus Tectomicrobia bacterium]
MILVCFAILIGTAHLALSLEPFDLKNMTCHITTPETKSCTGIPTLRSGVLTISTDGTFQLKAHYDGCFVIEDVTKSGKFHASHFKNSMSLELLSTQTAGVKDTASEFPRTLGFANLNDDNLDGYLVDFSAMIRGRGHHIKDVITSKLKCVAHE